jgi:hypothetical protein
MSAMEVTMRIGLVFALVLVCCVPCAAQDTEQRLILPGVRAAQGGHCSPMVNTRRGRVSTVDDRTLHGHVQCVDGESLAIETLYRDARGRLLRRVVFEPMSNIKQVVQLADSIGDGVVIGAAFAALAMLMPSGGDQCLNQTVVACTLGSVAAGAAIGGLIDAAHGRRLVLYPWPGHRAALGWRIRF